MRYFIPTKVYDEKNAVMNHACDLALFGRKALIVTGKSSAKKCGALGDVMRALDSQNISYSIYSDIEENPSTETVMKARDFGLSENTDFVIGIGGGSPMDAAKAIALMIKHSDRGEEYLFEKNADSSALPVITIPTTCGTGSEVTGASVLTIHEKKTKSGIPHSIFPNLSLIDSGYLKAASPEIIRNTAMDALSHLIESEINSDADDYSRIFSDVGLRLFGKVKAPLLSGSFTAEDYSLLMRTSTVAGMAIAHTATSIPHGLSYAVTYSLGIPHGKACGLFLKGYLDAAYKNGFADRVDKISELTGFGGTDDLHRFFEDTCGKVELSEEMKKYAADALFKNTAKLKKSPFEVSYDTLCSIAGVTE